jgi:hypothetical protein
VAGGEVEPWRLCAETMELPLGADGDEIEADTPQRVPFPRSSLIVLLKGVSGDITRVGEESIRGVRTTRYKAVVDVAKYRRAIPARARRTPTLLEGTPESREAREIATEVWIDERGLVRRQRFEQSIQRPRNVEIDYTIELFDFGADVEVALPARRDVIDLLQLLKKRPRRSSKPNQATSRSGEIARRPPPNWRALPGQEPEG